MKETNTETVLFTQKEIKDIVDRTIPYLKDTCSKFDKPPIFICVLNGGFMFFTDIIKQLDECVVDFIRPKSYNGKTQEEIKLLMDISVDISGRDVFVIDDIYDSGNTLEFINNHLCSKNPKSIQYLVLFYKKFSKRPNFQLMYGYELDKEVWLKGYGLDSSNGTQRNLPYILGEMIDD